MIPKFHFDYYNMRRFPRSPASLTGVPQPTDKAAKTIKVVQRYKSFICCLNVALTSHHPRGKPPFLSAPRGTAQWLG